MSLTGLAHAQPRRWGTVIASCGASYSFLAAVAGPDQAGQRPATEVRRWPRAPGVPQAPRAASRPSDSRFRPGRWARARRSPIVRQRLRLQLERLAARAEAQATGDCDEAREV